MSSRGKGQWMTTRFFPMGSANHDQTMQGVVTIQQSMDSHGAFTGDNMLSWGKNLSFAIDPVFSKAFLDANPNRLEQSLVWRVYTLYWAARRGLELDGDFVEAGVYKGFSARVLCNALGFAGLPRRFWLYDIFGVPDNPGLRLTHHTDQLFAEVTERFADVPNVALVQGPVEETMRHESNLPERIAFLHVDLNTVEAEMTVMDALHERLVAGSMVVLDDYGWAGFRAQKDAHDAFWQRRGKMIYEAPTGQGIVIV